MQRLAPPNGWVWLTFYLVLVAAIGLAIFCLRGTMLAALSTPEELDSWQDWRETAAKQDGTHGPVQRMEQPSAEPPMRILLRDHFPVVLISAMVFPGLILGFMLITLRGVWLQAGRTSPGLKDPLDEQHANSSHR